MLKQDIFKSTVEEILDVLNKIPKETLDKPVILGIWEEPIVYLKQIQNYDLKLEIPSYEDSKFLKTPFKYFSLGDVVLITKESCRELKLSPEKISGFDILEFLKQFEDKSKIVQTYYGDYIVNINQLSPKRTNVKYWKDCKGEERSDIDWWHQMLWSQDKENNLQEGQLIFTHEVNCI